MAHAESLLYPDCPVHG